MGRVKGELNGDYTSQELQLRDYLRMYSGVVSMPGWIRRMAMP